MLWELLLTVVPIRKAFKLLIPWWCLQLLFTVCLEEEEVENCYCHCYCLWLWGPQLWQSVKVHFLRSIVHFYPDVLTATLYFSKTDAITNFPNKVNIGFGSKSTSHLFFYKWMVLPDSLTIECKVRRPCLGLKCTSALWKVPIYRVLISKYSWSSRWAVPCKRECPSWKSLG